MKNLVKLENDIRAAYTNVITFVGDFFAEDYPFSTISTSTYNANKDTIRDYVNSIDDNDPSKLDEAIFHGLDDIVEAITIKKEQDIIAELSTLVNVNRILDDSKPNGLEALISTIKKYNGAGKFGFSGEMDLTSTGTITKDGFQDALNALQVFKYNALLDILDWECTGLSESKVIDMIGDGLVQELTELIVAAKVPGFQPSTQVSTPIPGTTIDEVKASETLGDMEAPKIVVLKNNKEKGGKQK